MLRWKYSISHFNREDASLFNHAQLVFINDFVKTKFNDLDFVPWNDKIIDSIFVGKHRYIFMILYFPVSSIREF